jgi:two-component system cell cycle response regulator
MTNEVGAKTRILVAEDDPVSRRVLELFLIKWGFEVVLCGSGIEALRLLERLDAPRLVLLDWMMPGMEGVEVCRKIRQFENRPYIYVLLLTARARKDDVLQGLGSGADDYVTKPFEPQELRARLNIGQRVLGLQDKLIASRDDLLFQATHDSLTHTSNRGVIMDRLRSERSRQGRGGGDFAIMFVDIDHFKHVNDMHGHLVGDAVLVEIADRIMKSVRPHDSVGRYGGEEFLIVAPSADAMGGLRLAQRIRQEIERRPVLVDGSSVSITASFGVAASTMNRLVDPQDMLRAADDALYHAKAGGRNRCELAATDLLDVAKQVEPPALAVAVREKPH